MWIPLDAIYALRQNDLMIKYRQPALPCFNMCFVLHTRLDTYGIRRLFHMQDYHIQTNGAGKKEKMGHWRKEKGENGTGLRIIQSLMFALLQKNVAAKMNAVADAHVNVPDSHVHYYAHARVNTYCSLMSDI